MSTTDRRHWQLPTLKTFAVAVGLASIGLSVLVWTLKAAGVGTMMFPGDRLHRLETAVVVEINENNSKHLPLDSLPARVRNLEVRVDTLAAQSSEARREREALLWLSCMMARQQLQSLQLPQICGEVRRR